MTGRAKWDAWAATGSKYTTPEDAEKRYIEIAKELGWDEAAAEPSGPSKEREDVPDDELLDSDEESAKPSSRKPREKSQDGSGGLGVSVSSMARPQEVVDNSIHGITVGGDVGKLKSLLESNPNINVNEKDQYVRPPYFLLPKNLPGLINCFRAILHCIWHATEGTWKW